MENSYLGEALKCFEEKDYKKALILFLEISDKEMIAQYYIGAIYRMGLVLRNI